MITYEKGAFRWGATSLTAEEAAALYLSLAKAFIAAARAGDERALGIHSRALAEKRRIEMEFVREQMG